MSIRYIGPRKPRATQIPKPLPFWQRPLPGPLTALLFLLYILAICAGYKLLVG